MVSQLSASKFPHAVSTRRCRAHCHYVPQVAPLRLRYVIYSLIIAEVPIFRDTSDMSRVYRAAADSMLYGHSQSPIICRACSTGHSRPCAAYAAPGLCSTLIHIAAHIMLFSRGHFRRAWCPALRIFAAFRRRALFLSAYSRQSIMRWWCHEYAF